MEGSDHEAGKNMNGVTYRSVLVNIDVQPGFDGTLVANSMPPEGANSAYQLVGFDAFGPNRDQRLLNSFNYFVRNDENSSQNFGSAVGNQRRWLAVIDGSTRTVLYNRFLPDAFQGLSLTATDAMEIRAAVNQAQLPTLIDPFTAWAEATIPDPEQRLEQDDPDGDDIVNLLEYAYGTNPVVPDADKAPRIELENGSPVLVFQRSTTAEVAPFTVYSGDSPATTEVFDISEIAQTGAETNGVTVIRVPLPSAASGRQFLRLSTLSLPQ